MSQTTSWYPQLQLETAKGKWEGIQTPLKICSTRERQSKIVCNLGSSHGEGVLVRACLFRQKLLPTGITTQARRLGLIFPRSPALWGLISPRASRSMGHHYACPRVLLWGCYICLLFCSVLSQGGCVCLLSHLKDL